MSFVSESAVAVARNFSSGEQMLAMFRVFPLVFLSAFLFLFSEKVSLMTPLLIRYKYSHLSPCLYTISKRSKNGQEIKNLIKEKLSYNALLITYRPS